MNDQINTPVRRHRTSLEERLQRANDALIALSASTDPNDLRDAVRVALELQADALEDEL